MKLKTAELKQFKQNASFIKTRGIIPILGYLKVDNGTITKTSLENFYTQKIDAKGSVLLDEVQLYNFLAKTPEPTIDITVKDRRIFISDGGTTPKVSFQEQDFSVFPSLKSVGEEEKYSISNEVFCAINFASKYTDSMDAPDARAHVFVGDNMVFGGNGIICYTEKFKENLPKMVILKDVAQVIGKFNEASFSENDNWFFFETEIGTYGFIKSTFPYTDMSKLISYSKDEYAFEVDKGDLLNFSDICVSASISKLKTATLSVKSNKLFMQMEDPDFNVDVNHSIPIGNGNMKEEFTFNPVMMSTMLNNIPDTELICYEKPKALIFTGPSGFSSIIQKLALINN